MSFQTRVLKTNLKIGIIFILAALLILAVTSCSRTEENTFPDVDALLCGTQPALPVSTEKDAICFAMYFDGIADSMRSAQKTAGYTGWTVKAEQRNDLGWDVYIHSKGKLPSYSCTVSFTKSGEIIENKEPCGYNK